MALCFIPRLHNVTFDDAAPQELAANVELRLGALASICILLRIPCIMGYEAAMSGHSKKEVDK